jgi:iduronate 2-sulfatase
MHRFYTVFCLLILAFAPYLTVSHAAGTKRPNVLFIIADDLNNCLGCYGEPMMQTPNIDRLAARGVRFDHAYCAFSLCGPSRNSFLTGLYPNSTGILANAQLFRQTIPSRVSLPQAFRQQGYFAARIGKLYHYNVPNSIGTNGHDDPASWEVETNPAGVDRLDEEPLIYSLTPGSFGGTLSWYASENPDEKHTDGLEAADAEWILERCAKQKDRPFFLAVGFFRPHTPYVAPKAYYDLYPREQVPVVPATVHDQKNVPAAALMSYKNEQDKLTDDLRRQARQAYYASVSFMDAQTGRVLAALDRLGLRDNTIVVFTSDHGYHLGEHGLWQKQSLFEESARVPLIIAGPGVLRPGSVAESPVGLIDLYPTLAELAGVKPPAVMQGQSLASILQDATAVGRGWALTQVVRGGGFKRFGASPSVGDNVHRFFGYSLRTARWRFTEWDEGREGRELYDHDADPKEAANLATDDGHAAIVAELSAKLHDAVKSTFPADGKTPELHSEMWAPNLTNP